MVLVSKDKNNFDRKSLELFINGHNIEIHYMYPDNSYRVRVNGKKVSLERNVYQIPYVAAIILEPMNDDIHVMSDKFNIKFSHGTKASWQSLAFVFTVVAVAAVPLSVVIVMMLLLLFWCC